METMTQRSSGILLHVTSLPSPFGIGDMGPDAYDYVDFLSQTGQALWQILPLNPTDTASYDSPYHSTSAFACNPLLISPELMVRDGFLSRSDLEPLPAFPLDKVDYLSVTDYKKGLFQKAFEVFRAGKERPDYRAFCEANSFWLEDFALFMALKGCYEGKTWLEWPSEIRQRWPDVLKGVRDRLSEALEKQRFLQYLFLRQWSALKAYANGRGIRILGDIPIYVVHNSTDVWAHPEIFNLDKDGRPLTVAGVPPDYFSETGQLWGNPVYRWDVMRKSGYGWWIQRMGQNLKLFDLMRLDHFRGFVAYWEVPADEEDAVRGRWVQAPAMDFFERITQWFPSLSLVAEDLGTITPDVTDMMNHFGFPGMKVLLFAFSDDRGSNPYLPHNHVRNCVVYTGTHDNNTIRGWFDMEATDEEKRRLFLYLGREVSSSEIPWELIRLAMMSVASSVAFPMQDLLGLGAEARMNRPGKKAGNWHWRLLREQLTPQLSRKLLEMTRGYGRAG
jgi:4-alpha-glucanotransferase